MALIPSMQWRPGFARGCETNSIPRMTCSPVRTSWHSPSMIQTMGERSFRIGAELFHQTIKSGPVPIVTGSTC